MLFGSNNSVSLSWNSNPAEEYISGYEVKGTKNGGMQQSLLITESTSCVLENLEAGVWSFQVRALNLAGVGPLSDAVSTPSLPTYPESISLTVEII